MQSNTDWNKSRTRKFWGEIASCEHVLHLYNDESNFIDLLAGFAGDGINAGESVIVIATTEHLDELEKRLIAHGIHIDSLMLHNQYIPLDAKETLAKFMVNGWPEEHLFMHEVEKQVSRAKHNNPRVRAFGEMVALLWKQGLHDATVELERLWNKYCATQELCLFCAYPENCFTSVMDNSMNISYDHICSNHSRIISSTDKPLTEIRHRNLHQDQVA